jgi:uncharacterized membrane protein YqjE
VTDSHQSGSQQSGSQQAGDDAADQASLSDDLRRLVDQGKALGQAELAWQKARAAYAGRQAGFIVGLAALAAALATFALVALVLGALMALTPPLGPWGATAAVAGGLLLAALIAAGIAMLKLRRTARLIADKGAAK